MSICRTMCKRFSSMLPALRSRTNRMISDSTAVPDERGKVDNDAAAVYVVIVVVIIH